MQIFNGASEMTEEGMIGKTPFNVADDAADDKNIAFDIAGDEADASPAAEPAGDVGKEEEEEEEDPFSSAAATSIEKVIDDGPKEEPKSDGGGLFGLGHVMKWGGTSGEDKSIVVEEPSKVSIESIEAETKQEEEEENGAKEALDKEFKDADKVVYKTLEDLLVSHHLGAFILQFFNHGVGTLDALKGCTDDFLTEQIGMKKAHRLKFRRALKDAHIDSLSNVMSIYEAPDGRSCCCHNA